MNVIERELDQRIVPQLLEMLDSGHVLARLVRDAKVLNGARIRTFLPAGIPDNYVYDRWHGNEMSRAVGLSWLASNLSEFLRKDYRAVVVMENANATKGDPGLSEMTSKLAYMDSEIVHILRNEDSDERQIKKSIGEAESLWQFVGLMTQASDKVLRASFPLELNRSDAEELVAHTRSVFFGAYDGESYIICSF
jgi:hypothetical protein